MKYWIVLSYLVQHLSWHELVQVGSDHPKISTASKR